MLLGVVGSSAPQPPQSNLVMWLKADAGITQAAGTVSAWADQSGNGNNVAQANGALQPTFTASAINGLPGLDFSAGGGTVLSNTTANPIVSGTARHVFAAVKSVASTGTGGYVMCFRTAAPYFAVMLANIAGTVYNYRDGGATLNNISPPPTLPGVVYATEHLYAGGTAQCLCTLNGTAQTIVGGVVTSDTGTTGFSIGNNPGTPAFDAFDGVISEVLVYSAQQTGANLTAVRAYFLSRYGIS